MTHLNEQMSLSYQMDVSKLRELYYGRTGMFIVFTDDGKIERDGQSDPKRVRPDGILCHRLNDVVGRKVASPDFYQAVYKYHAKESKGYVDNIYKYTNDDLNLDIRRLKGIFGDIVDEVEIRQRFDRNNLVPFQIFWQMTYELSLGESRIWKELLLKLGYTGFNDPRGRRIFSSQRGQCAIIISNEPQLLDIITLQKFKKDKRRTIGKRIDRINKANWVRRNRYAKKRTDRFHRDGRKGFA